MIDIIAVTYGHNEILKCFINSIKSQTSNNWRLVLIHDGPNEKLKKELENENYLNDKISFIEYPERTENFGHKLRKWAIENVVENEYLLLTNGDNYYTPNMVYEVSQRNEDFIYFDMIHSYSIHKNHNQSSYGYLNCRLEFGSIDMGCVVMRSGISKKIGFNQIKSSADWDYFNEALKVTNNIYKINKILFVHN